VPLVLPYLLRRAAENSSILKGTKQDLVLVQKELLRRASGLSWGLSG
jgi:proline dehydrogenase